MALISTAPVDIPQGWPEIGLGLLIAAIAALIYVMNRGASMVLGSGDRYERSQRIGAGLFIASGLFVVVVWVVHLL